MDLVAPSMSLSLTTVACCCIQQGDKKVTLAWLGLMCRLLYCVAVCLGTIKGWPQRKGGLNVWVAIAGCVITIKGWPHWTGGLNVQVVILCGSLSWDYQRLATNNRWPQCMGCYCRLCEDHQMLATLNRWPQCAGCYIIWQFV